ncbi:MAG TPA: hypothetical protein VGO78_24100, partial [Acidimicrobiales bacterium]|nr:hypothetical protein [Acidimicrobiales bacterium]
MKQADGGVETRAEAGPPGHRGRRRLRRGGAFLLVALVVVLGVAPGPVAAHEASGAAPGQEV